MKRSKRMIALVSVFAVICIATFIVTRYEEKKEAIKNSDAIILQLPADSVTSVSWSFGETGLAFHKGEDGWLYDEDEAFPVNEEKITKLLSHFESFGVSFIIEDVEDYGQYGLKDPEGVICLATSEKNYEIKLGTFSTMDELRYVDIGDGKVYLVREDPMDFMAEELSEMILHDEIPKLEDVQKICYEGDENYTISCVRDSAFSYSDEDIYFVTQKGENVPLDTDKISTYLNTISSLSLNNYVTYNASEEELQAYGLDSPDLTITMDYIYTDGDDKEKSDTLVLHIGSNVSEGEAAKKAEEQGDEDIPSVTRYVRVGESQIVYQLAASSYETLMAASYEDLRHDEVFWADSSLITEMEITLEGETHTLSSKVEDDTRTWYFKDKEIDVSNLKTALKTIKATTFTDEEAKQKEEISLTLYLDNTDFPQVKIQFYRYDGTGCLAVVDGESVSFVERAAVMELVEAALAIVLE